MTGRATGPRGDAAAADVTRALAALGLTATEWERIGGWRMGRVTFRLLLDDGRVVKARRHPGVHRGERAAVWTRVLADPGFPPPLARVGRVTVDPWVPGDVVHPSETDSATLHAAAGLLARLHAVERLDGRAVRSLRSTDALRRNLDSWLRDLVASGTCPADDATRLAATVQAALPARAVRGLTHGDFAAENLVRASGTLVSVDNEAVGTGFLGQDLARTWCRWPMPDRAWAHFERIVRVHDPDWSRDAALAWHALEAARGAHRHARARGTGDDRPRRALARIVAEVRAR